MRSCKKTFMQGTGLVLLKCKKLGPVWRTSGQDGECSAREVLSEAAAEVLLDQSRNIFYFQNKIFRFAKQGLSIIFKIETI